MAEARKGGRPPVAEGDESVRVCVTLPAKQFDEYSRRALHQDVSVPEIIRRALELEKKSKNP